MRDRANTSIEIPPITFGNEQSPARAVEIVATPAADRPAQADVLLEVERSYKPNLLANFLYELATQFNLFYQAHPVLKAPEDRQPTRLLLCSLTARYLKTGLELLGIETLEAM